MRPLIVPTAPHDLWRRIYQRVTEHPETFSMETWHGHRIKTFCGGEQTEDLVQVLEGVKEKRCASTHCVAGYITFLTPGGLRYEENLNRRQVVYNLREMLMAQGLNDRAIMSSDVTGTAAWMILEKSGWMKDLKPGVFTSSRDAALRELKRLARLEAQRERKQRG
jgi:hypothetical protein